MASDDSSPAELKPLGVMLPPPLSLLFQAGLQGDALSWPGEGDCELSCTNTVLIENCPSLAFNLLCHLNLQFVLMNWVSLKHFLIRYVILCFLDMFWYSPASVTLVTVRSVVMKRDAHMKTLIYTDNLIIYIQIAIQWREIQCLLIVNNCMACTRSFFQGQLGLSGSGVEDYLAWARCGPPGGPGCLSRMPSPSGCSHTWAASI